jgi:hypothetical protein
MSAKDAKFFVTRLYLFDVCLIRVIAYRSLKLLKSNRKNRSPLREGVLRVVLPPAIVLSATITWAGDVKNPANDSLLAMSPRHQADILGKIAGEACKGKTAFYQGTMKDLSKVITARNYPFRRNMRTTRSGISCVRMAAVTASRCILTAATRWWSAVW